LWAAQSCPTAHIPHPTTSKEKFILPEDTRYKATYAGSGTFIISKPKRKSMKRRQAKLKNPQRGARK